MKKGIQISSFVFMCFTLMGCPPGNFYAYSFLGKSLSNDHLAYARMAYDTTHDLYARVGFFHAFVKDKQRDLVVWVKSKLDLDIEASPIVQKVYSTHLSVLNKAENLKFVK